MKSRYTKLIAGLIGIWFIAGDFRLANAQDHHILPEGIREQRQERAAALSDVTRFPQVFRYQNQQKSNSGSWLPGEFEESQAVVLSWGEYSSLEAVDTTSSLALISAKLCMGIQPEAPVWIRIHKAADSLPVKRYMENMGEPLYNYRFVVKFGDNWWARDFGPIGYYQGSQDSLCFSDFKYYPGREHDNALPAATSYRNGWKNVVTRMNYEGGNLIADGFGKTFYSDVVTDANSATGTHFPTLAASLVADSMAKALHASEIVQLPALSCDGGTGHLDLYLKMMDEETWIAAQYPSAITASDRQLTENNINFIKTLTSVYDRPFRIFRVPLPTDNNGTYSQQLNCNGLNSFGRSFINGITVNKTFIYPIWDSPGSGNSSQRIALEANMRRWFPGLKLFGIDVRAMTGFGGQLHCITMQIPAENPVKFWHPALRDAQLPQSEYRLLATIKNKSGIASAVCKWRKGSAGVWNELTLTDSSGYFIARIPGAEIAVGDTVQYYLSTTTVNGKTAFKPITAPEGYYQFVVTELTQLLSSADDAALQLFPNPGDGLITLEMPSGAKTELTIMDASGKIAGFHVLEGGSQQLKLAALPQGLYLFLFSRDGKKIATRKYARN